MGEIQPNRDAPGGKMSIKLNPVAYMLIGREQAIPNQAWEIRQTSLPYQSQHKVKAVPTL